MNFSISDIRIGINCSEESVNDSEFFPFLTDQDTTDMNIRIISNASVDEADALSEFVLLDEHSAELRVCDRYAHLYEQIRRCFMDIPIERILLLYRRLIFHSSIVQWRDKGILFSGRSGSGKSTQSNLWKEYEDAHIINGDRAILAKDEGQWYAYGSPYAGSSNIFLNERIDVHAIVFLDHGKQNKLRLLNNQEKSLFFLEQIYMQYPEDEHLLDLFFDVVNEIVVDIPMYRYSCLPDESSVKYLKSVLWEGNHG